MGVCHCGLLKPHNMKHYLLLCLILASAFSIRAQSVYRSIEQIKYAHGMPMRYISTSRYFLEISFHLRAGFIQFTNKDLHYEDRFINVIPTETPSSWRAFSTKTQKAYLIGIKTDNSGKSITLDDELFVYVIKVNEAVILD